MRFSRIRQPRLYEQVAGRIRADIAAGTIRPGHKLPPERDLAGQLGVSRTVVREALHSLEVSGLIKTYKGAKGGTFVLDGSSSVVQTLQSLFSAGKFSIRELTATREILLCEIVRLACEKATAAGLESLRKDTDRIEEQSRTDPRERLNCSFDFHVSLGRLAGNRLLAAMSEASSHLIRLIIDHVGLPPFNVVPSHRRLLTHMCARDASAAVGEMADHMARLHRYVLRRSKQLEANPSWLTL